MEEGSPPLELISTSPMRFPRAFPLRNLEAAMAFRIATRGAPSASVEANVLPVIRRKPCVATKSSVALVTSAIIALPPLPPAMASSVVTRASNPFIGGNCVTAAACLTPGIAANRSDSISKNGPISARLYFS